MARIEQGNALTTPLQQPGAKFQNDGYGLWTGSVSFKVDKNGSSASFYRGAPCPISGLSFCKMHKASVEVGALNLDTWVADYVGIDPSVNSGTRTEPQITSSQGLTSENITTHPNFFETATGSGFTGDPIAGVGDGTVANPEYPAVEGVSNQFEGNNGATFEATTGRKFLGFRKPEFKDFYGKTNYLAPTTSIAGVFYTSSSTNVTNLRDRVGKTSGTGTFASINLLPTYLGSSYTISGKNQLLLAQVSFEDYGLLYKIQYELRYNREGYAPAVYAPA